MRARSALWAGLLLGLCVGGLAVAADQPLLLMELPADGPWSATVKAAYASLQPQYDIQWVKVHEAAQRDRPPTAIILTPGAKLLKETELNLADYVRNGGGLVLVTPLGQEQREQANGVLRPLGVRLVAAEKDQGGEVTLLPHAVSEGVGGLPARSFKAGLSSDALEPVVTWRDRPLVVAGMVGQGRVVVLAQPLLVTETPSRAADSPQARLLTNAIAWAAGRGLAPAESNPAAGVAATDPPVAAGLDGKMLTDFPATPEWQAVVAAAKTQLSGVGLQEGPLGYQAGARTLATALTPPPALVLLTPYRDIEEPEMAALAEYVSGGGSLLVLEYCPDAGERALVKKVASLNRALGEFGISYTLGRPAGQGVAKPHPITENLGQPTRVGAGGAVWAYAQWPLATVGESVVAGAHEFRQGRIVVLDASTLLPPKQKGKKVNSAEWFGKLLRSSVGWLTGR